MQLDHPESHLVDLSGFVGLSFWMRARENTQLGVALGDGKRVGDFTNPNVGRRFTKIDVSEEWQLASLSFEEFGFDARTAVDVATIEFWLETDGSANELWIDGLTLVPLF